MKTIPACGAPGPNGMTCDLWLGHDGRHSRTTIESWEQAAVDNEAYPPSSEGGGVRG